MRTDIERQLRTLQIATDLKSVYIEFEEIVTMEPKEGEEESSVVKVPYSVDSPYKPHSDLVNAMKKLRQHGLALYNIKLEDSSKQLKNWTVGQIKVSGDVLMKQSRVVISLGIFSEDTGKVGTLKCPEVTMYGESQYKDHEKLAKDIELILAETWLYMGGKYEDAGQLPLFQEIPALKKAS